MDPPPLALALFSSLKERAEERERIYVTMQSRCSSLHVYMRKKERENFEMVLGELNKTPWEKKERETRRRVRTTSPPSTQYAISVVANWRERGEAHTKKSFKCSNFRIWECWEKRGGGGEWDLKGFNFENNPVERGKRAPEKSWLVGLRRPFAAELREKKGDRIIPLGFLPRCNNINWLQ